MNYSFDEKTGSVLVRETETGRRWENYLWNETKYGFFLTKTDHLGGSVSWMLRSTSERVSTRQAKRSRRRSAGARWPLRQ